MKGAIVGVTLEFERSLRDSRDEQTSYVLGKFHEFWQVAEEFGSDEPSERWNAGDDADEPTDNDATEG